MLRHLRRAQLEDEQRDHDREHAVRERFETILRHARQVRRSARRRSGWLRSEHGVHRMAAGRVRVLRRARSRQLPRLLAGAPRLSYDASVKAPFLALSELIEKEFGPLRAVPARTVTRGSRRTRARTRRVPRPDRRAGRHALLRDARSRGAVRRRSGYYMFAPDQLDRWRAAIADARSGPAMEKAIAAVAQAALRGRARTTR